MITEVRLFRHAESEMNLRPNLVGGRSNWALLTLKGVEQTRQRSRQLSEEGYHPDVVYSSPAERTIQTALGVMSYIGVTEEDLVIDDNLQEQTHGQNEGLYRERVYTLERKVQAEKEQLDFVLDGGESLRQVGERMLHGWLLPTLEREKQAGRIAAFAHGTATRSLVACIEEKDQEWILSTQTPNLSDTRILFDRETKRLTVDYIGKITTAI